MKTIDPEQQARPGKKLVCFIADSEALIKEAQALRYRVFAQEMGATLKSGSEGLDYDEVDDFCEHLVVYDNLNDKIVGYTRLLNQAQAKRLGRFYSQNEFILDQVLALPGRFLEVGRTCVDPDYRGGAVLTTLWSALVQYALEGQYNYLLGCASITPGPSGFAIDAVYRNIDPQNIATPALRVQPLIPVPKALRCQRDESGIPPLLKAYLRFGALICGDPYWDEDFNCMDLFILLPLDQIQERYSKHYMRGYIARDGVYAQASRELARRSPGRVCMPQASRELARQSPGMVRMPQACWEQSAAQAANEVENTVVL